MAKKAKKGFPVTKMEQKLVKYSCGGFVHISGKKTISNFAEMAPCGPHVRMELSVQKFTAKKSQGGNSIAFFPTFYFPGTLAAIFIAGKGVFRSSSSAEEIFELSEK